jgi:hypothetical protein
MVPLRGESNLSGRYLEKKMETYVHDPCGPEEIVFRPRGHIGLVNVGERGQVGRIQDDGRYRGDDLLLHWHFRLLVL